MQPLKNCIGPTIRIGREIRCLPHAGFFVRVPKLDLDTFLQIPMATLEPLWFWICVLIVFQNTFVYKSSINKTLVGNCWKNTIGIK